ncbi:STE/STE20 protein kinase [Alternaria rosae]|uniref:STE/STE20 protein kinase n=1 Tax=Alternaria rosae TaxID=1187941 RepID=UPI001E8E23B1|nr:STE/STE20 protein kinase [Alternaria rosae]KAH6875667.1 STE/STE20 protein kinase [Alternaria rosae]
MLVASSHSEQRDDGVTALMSFLLRAGQVLKGQIGSYTITKQVQSTLWFAKDQGQRRVVIKGGHQTVQVERDALKMFQHCPHIRPLVDDIDGPPTMPPLIALRHLDSDVLAASIERKLSREELKYVTRRLLLGLNNLHEKGYVHSEIWSSGTVEFVLAARYKARRTRVLEQQFRDNYILELIIFEDLKPDNVYVNMQEGDNRFNEVKLDIWAFGLLADDLYAKFAHMIYGSYINPCIPEGPRIEDDRPNLPLDVMLRQLHWFGPFPEKIVEVADAESADIIPAFKEYNMPAQQGIFETIPETTSSKKDNKFIRKMMKLDWRDRPSARDLLEDEWWIDE